MAGGRQREFDKQEALDAAMRVFWKKGFAGASLSDLTDSMGINKPSLYSTFGNKEQLFVQATGHYLSHYAQRHRHFLEEKGLSVKARLRNFMLSAVRAQCDKSCPKGCYISLCVAESAGEEMPEGAANMTEKALSDNESALVTFFKNEQAEGNLPSHKPPKSLALYIMTVLHGTATMARAGKKMKDLEWVVDQALTGLLLGPD